MVTSTETSPPRIVSGAFESFVKALWRQSPTPLRLKAEARADAHCASAKAGALALLASPASFAASPYTSTTRARAERETRERTPNAADVISVTVSSHHSQTNASGDALSSRFASRRRERHASSSLRA
jgi:hypothetical protein